MNVKTTGIIIVAVLAMAVIAVAGYMSFSGKPDASASIRQALVGTNLTYYSIAGVPMNYTIGREDIKSIEPTTYKEKSAWKVRVGEGLAWDLTIDADGKNILYTDQLFMT